MVKGLQSSGESAETKSILQNIKTALINPSVLAGPAGLLISIFSIELPYVITRSMSYLAATVSPLGMILIGLSLPQNQFKKNFKELLTDKAILPQAFVRLIIAPLTALLLLSLFNVAPIVRNIAVINCALPAGMGILIFARNFNSDVMTSVRATLTTTLLSLLTLPVWIAWVSGTG